MSATAPIVARDAIACPRCAAAVGPEQDWCLACGDAARTRLAAPPVWKAPIALLAVIALVAGLALVLAFAEITSHDAPVTQTTPASAPADAPAPGG